MSSRPFDSFDSSPGFDSFIQAAGFDVRGPLGGMLGLVGGSSLWKQSQDDGETWDALGSGSALYHCASSGSNIIASLIAAQGYTLLSGSEDNFFGAVGTGIYRSTDGGANFDWIRDGLSTDGVIRSVDGGEHWTSVLAADATHTWVSVCALGDNIVLAGGWVGSTSRKWTIMRSTNNGDSWSVVKQQTTGQQVCWVPAFADLGGGVVIALVFDSPTGVGTWYEKIYRSTDSGATWSLVKTIVADLSYDACALSSTVAVVAVVGYVYTSSDGGATWHVTFTDATGIHSPVRVRRVSDTIALMQTYNGDTYRSDDSGETWDALGTSYSFSDWCKIG